MTEREELSDKLGKIIVPVIPKRPAEKRPYLVKVNGKIISFPDKRAYFDYRKQKQETKRKTDALYQDGKVQPPPFYSPSKTEESS